MRVDDVWPELPDKYDQLPQADQILYQCDLSGKGNDLVVDAFFGNGLYFFPVGTYGQHFEALALHESKLAAKQQLE